MKRTLAGLGILVLFIGTAVTVASVAHASTTPEQVAHKADGLLKFKSCDKNCQSATDKFDYITVTVRDGLVMMAFQPLNTLDANGNLTGASYMQIDVEKAVIEHYCGVAGWNWLISPHGAFYRWGTSKNPDYITYTNLNHHHLAFAADNQTATYTITVTL